ncbi:putative Outer envelope membrane protein 7 [Cocos nucifera]|uniref:Putative Outer envelope membrane protein 7 n=1 Tax=Cocos nucifera TaxID=13894 RepID=A0A8K0IPI8_COCNU|nr:putative Outer envelope membrane protein 7 [Cocos nucifera]
MGRREREGGGLKTALVVAGGLVLAWMTMETAFKPFLDRVRSSISRSDPARDPDDGDETVGVGASDEDEKDEGVAKSV